MVHLFGIWVLRFSGAIIFAVLGPFSVRVAQRELAHYFRSLKAKTSHVLSHQLSQHFAARFWPKLRKIAQNAPKSLKNRSQRSMPRDTWPMWGVCAIYLALIARKHPQDNGFCPPQARKFSIFAAVIADLRAQLSQF